MRLPDPCLVVLVGATASGKSHWAGRWFDAGAVVSSDGLRAVVGTGERDVRASADAFELQELIVSKRLRRGLTTVVDSLNLDPRTRAAWRELALGHGVPAFAVVFDTPEKLVRERNRRRADPLPPNVVAAQLRQLQELQLDAEGFAGVFAPEAVELVAPQLLTAPAAAQRQREAPLALSFGLQLSRFDSPVADMARAAEAAGFESLWLMDHFVQIPQVGREWEDMLESYTTLGYLAAVTERIGLGTLVTAVSHRNIAHLAKVVATLDVLSGGRALCGLGAGWYEREQRLYGYAPVRDRFARLEDALELLPLMWGAGAPAFQGRTISVPEAICYPRPHQERVPLLVGGQGERRTLRLAARHADACNLFGDPATVRHKLEVLRAHCAAEQRDPAQIAITHLSQPGPPATTVAEHVGRYRELAEAGVQLAIVALADLESVRRFSEVVAAFPRARALG